MNARDPQIESLLARLDRIRGGEEALDIASALDAYTRAVGEMRAIALDARRRLEQAAVAIAEAREHTRRRRRRADKQARARPHAAEPDG